MHTDKDAPLALKHPKSAEDNGICLISRRRVLIAGKYSRLPKIHLLGQ